MALKSALIPESRYNDQKLSFQQKGPQNLYDQIIIIFQFQI